ncbi:MAG: tRNA pseudouridine(13) synthase TruD [Aquificae bacterium]|nr:tRNA pseudouridine(13) synthase TruD [Aquificota bacterium]
MEKVVFNWNIKEKPEDFIVSEVGQHLLAEDGEFFLYRLIKRGLNTKDITSHYNLRYAGLKDKNALTFQYVSSKDFLGETVFKKVSEGRFFGLVYLGRVRRQIRIGQLKGNRFSIKLKENVAIQQDKNWFINYYDLQRISRNRERGKALLKKLPDDTKWKRLNWFQNFYIDAYLSHLWNRAVMELLKEKFDGYLIVDNGLKYFFPYTDYTTLENSFKRYIPILGYKVKLDKIEETVYLKVLKKEGFSLEWLLERLKNLGIKGDYRKTFSVAEGLSIKGDRVNFFLQKGSYATMFLKSIFLPK